MDLPELADLFRALQPPVPTVSAEALAAVRAAAEPQAPPPPVRPAIEVHPFYRLPEDPQREENRRRLQAYLEMVVETQVRAQAHAANLILREVYRDAGL